MPSVSKLDLNNAYKKKIVSFYEEDVERWIRDAETHRDGLKGRVWLLDKLIDEIKTKRVK